MDIFELLSPFNEFVVADDVGPPPSDPNRPEPDEALVELLGPDPSETLVELL